MNVRVIKADGTEEPFQMEKLTSSLSRSGASLREVEDITRTIEKQLIDGITTQAIYREAFELLKERGKSVAARYSLRRAMVDLGPTGFPFEDYLARLFTKHGYATHVRMQIQGKCVPHEVDMVAYKGGECIVAEAKFHMQVGLKSDLQVVLYSHSRFLDIEGARAHAEREETVSSSWVITNTKFTTMAIKYAECSGMHLLSWGYPKVGNLQDMIEAKKLYPITVLESLTTHEKQSLLAQGTVLCSEVIDNHALLRSADIPHNKIGAILEEGARLCAIE